MKLGAYLLCVAICLFLAVLHGADRAPGEVEAVPFTWTVADVDTRPAWFNITWEDGRQMSFDARHVTVLSYFPPGWGHDHAFIELTTASKTQRIDLPAGSTTASDLKKAMFEANDERREQDRSP